MAFEKLFFGLNLEVLGSMEYIDIGGTSVAIDRSIVSEAILGAMAKRQYEHVEARIGAAMLEEDHFPGDQVLLEIGAGLGFVGSRLFKTGKINKIFSYEANAGLIPLIQETHSVNRVVSEVRHAVLGPEGGGDTEFFVPHDFWAASTKPREFSEKLICPRVSLNDAISDTSPTILMVDIEGGEKDLFKSSVTLGGVQQILIEIHQSMIGRAGIVSFFSDMCRLGFSYDQKFSLGKVLVFQRADMPL
jgi:FkbM family methyltransferase